MVELVGCLLWLIWWVACSGCVGELLVVVELVGCLQWLSWWVACCGCVGGLLAVVVLVEMVLVWFVL